MDLFIGVDTGGTFTDIVFRYGKRSGTYKLLSTPDDPARAVITGVRHLFGTQRPDLITYGTTVATNAMLERRGARTALVTTSGFEDVLEIGRQARPRLYDLEPVKPEPLVPSRLRLGLHERVLHDGSVETTPGETELGQLAERIERAGVESVAVCLLHSHVNGRHERLVESALRPLGIPVTVSHRLSPAAGEFERSSTACVNAYVAPVMERHLERLASKTRAGRLRVMQSNGGAIGLRTAVREPVRTVLSGPAGGVSAAAECARELGLDRIVTLDMGGTSTDVALVDGGLVRRAISEIGGIPVRSPCVDIHTVGAGGGSIAHVDAGGSLKVGPRSAGADPGPACYGKGDQPTVTDANLVLGRLIPENFLGGAMNLDTARAERVMTKLARQMKTRGPLAAAEGVVQVIESNMERAIRVITVERGQDPRTCTLVSFGGAAGLHACGLAEKLDMKSVLIPKDPGLLSARGVLTGPVLRDVAESLRLTDPGLRQLERLAEPLARRARRQVEAEGIAATSITTQAFVQLRYLGQSMALEVPLDGGFRSAFDTDHQRLFHYCNEDRAVEAVGLRVTATGYHSGVSRLRMSRPPRKPPAKRARRDHSAGVFTAQRLAECPVYLRADLEPGSVLRGPAIVAEYSSTAYLPPGWRLWVDALDNLRLERGRG